MNNDLRILFFEVTQKCNAHCDHCGSSCDINSSDGIPKELFMKVLDDVKKNFGTKIMINITGGEPLLRKDLFEIMAYANKLDFDWGMVTNGTLISESVIKKMKETGMKTITISIDGMKETHESFRHLPGSFNRIIQNIIDLKDADFLEHIQVTFIANKKNIYELPAVWRMFDNLGIDSLRVSSIDPIGRANDNENLFLDSNDFKYLINFIETTNNLNRLPIVWSCSHYLGDEGDSKLGRHFECITGKHVASILYNGDIFACPNIPRIPELIQGNIKVDKFSDVWKNKFEPFRYRKLNSTCEGCNKKELCNGDSFHTWNFEENKPNFCYKEVLGKNSSQEFTMKKLEIFLKEKYPNIKCENHKISSINKTIVIEPDAYKDIKNYFHLGEKKPTSMYEQQMGLIGFKYKNFYIVKYVVPSLLKNRTRNMGYVDSETIANILDEVNIINENFYISDDRNDLIYGKLEFLGFIHSHPMDVDFEYSEGDYEFQKLLVNRFKDNISLLVNPEKNLIKAIYDKDCKEANLKILKI